MEPKLPAENLRSEQLPVNQGQYVEQMPTPSMPEAGIEAGGERVEQRGEAAPRATTAVPVLPPPLATSTPTPPPLADNAVTPPADDVPLVANDDDLIEKEWVDKAKKIIAQTKDDPYKRGQEVSKLQADYLRKRYGRELGASQ